MVKYSFVMPAYKAAYIREAIDSILGQTYTATAFELIIVDDASPDGLDAIVAEYHDPRITYYKNEHNIGGKDLVAQWNHSIGYSSGQYIILASDDDVYDRSFLEVIDRYVERYPIVNVLRPRIQRIDSNGKIRYEEKYETDSDVISYKVFLDAFCSEKLCSGIPQYVFNADKLRQRGGFISFPTAWFSDDATVASMADNGIVFINETLFSFRDSSVNISGRFNSFDSISLKVDASVAFYSFITQLLKEDYHIDVPDNLVNRIRRTTIFTLKNASISSFLKGLIYINSLNTSLYPISWQVRRLLGYFYNKVKKLF